MNGYRFIEVGDVYGKLTVKGFCYGVRVSGARKKLNICLCSCGNEVKIESGNLRSGNTSQCTDCAKITRGENRKTHGNSVSFRDRDPIGYNCYTRWQSMKRRCYNPKSNGYADYGGRGISVCDSWLDSYESFLTDMGLPPTSKHQLDREDNEGNYQPGNCRWVTPKVNARNKRNNIRFEVDGVTRTLPEWAEISGVDYATLKARIYRGVAPHLAIKKEVYGKYTYSTPRGEFGSLSAAAKSFKMSVSGANGRFESATHPEWNKHVRT